MANQNPMTLIFEVYKGDTLIKTADFREESITIGSAATALLTVDDASVADLHAVVNIEDDGAVVLLDLGHEPGVTVNGARVSNAPTPSGPSFNLGSIPVVPRYPPADGPDYQASRLVPALP